MQEYFYYLPTLNLPGMERSDPVLTAFAGMFGIGSQQVLLLQLAVIAVGSGVFFAESFSLASGIGHWQRRSVLAVGLFLGASLFVLGPDPVSFRWHWFPLTAGLGAVSIRSGRLLPFTIYLFCLIQFVIAAGSLGPIGTLILLLMLTPSAYALLFSDISTERTLLSRSVVPALLCALVLAVIFLPVYPMPEYPGEAQLAPLSAFTLYGTPLIGPYLRPLPIVFATYSSLLAEHFFRIAVFVAVLSLTPAGKARTGAARTSRTGFLLTFLLLLIVVGAELAFSPQYLRTTPFPTLRRIIPGLEVSPLPWLLAPFGLFIGIALWLRAVRFRNACISAGAFAAIGLFVVLGGGVSSIASAELSTRHAQRSEPMRWGPSRYLLALHGDWAKEPRSFEMMRRLVRGTDFEASVTASPNAAAAENAVDSVVETRWATARVQQAGDYFEISFVEPTPVLRVVLSVKGVPGDFPRGVSIEVQDAGGSWHEVFRQTDWLGPIKWSASGLPYFGPQAEVILDLPEEVLAKKIKFTQIGYETIYDWSISEVKLYRSLLPG